MNAPQRIAQCRHLIDPRDITLGYFDQVLLAANHFAKTPRPEQALIGKVMIPAFNEPSTRTIGAFCRSTLALGGSINAMVATSSLAKGESYRDHWIVTSFYGDFIVLRDKDPEAARVAAQYATVPVFNAGCGDEWHPTQGLLDLITCHRRLGGLDGAKIGFVGDLAGSRAARSASVTCSLFPTAKQFYFAPEGVGMKSDVTDHLAAKGVNLQEFSTPEALWDMAPELDAIIVTRAQLERRDTDEKRRQLREILAPFRIDREFVERMRTDAVVAHSLPRETELAEDVDDMPQQAYLGDELHAGIHTRMAVLVLNVAGANP